MGYTDLKRNRFEVSCVGAMEDAIWWPFLWGVRRTLWGGRVLTASDTLWAVLYNSLDYVRGSITDEEINS